APPVGAVADPTRSPEPVEPSEAEEGEEESEAVDSVAAEAVPHPEAADLADAADASNAANASDTANAADAHSVEAADPIEIVEFVEAPDPSRTVGAGDLDAELGAGEHAGIIEEHAEATGHDAAASEHAAPTRRGPVLKARPSNPATAVSSAAGGSPAGRPRTSALTDALLAELQRTDRPTVRSELLVRLARTGDPAASAAIRPWTEAAEPSVRAAAYEALGRLLDRDPAALEPHLRNGLAGTVAGARSRVGLALATARGVAPRWLVAPLRKDPDPQVRRVVREVLRRIPPAGPAEPTTNDVPSLPHRALGVHK